MNTLIELYSKHNINNVLACDVFRPKKVIFLCSAEFPVDENAKRGISDFLTSRNPEISVVFESVDRYSTKQIIEVLNHLISQYPECTIDITGGSDNMLFAVGVASASHPVEVITYSYKTNRFFNIQNAEYVNNVLCNNLYTVSDFIEIAGGKVLAGRIIKESLDSHMSYIDPLFKVFIKNKRKWYNIVSWFQHACNGSCTVNKISPYQKNIRGKLIRCPDDCLRDLNKAGLISDLVIDDTISFKVLDEQILFWLCDNGSALEVYTYKNAVDSGIFNDVACSVIIDWTKDSDRSHTISNEIDVMGIREMTPYFISCKACKVDTDALNELDIIRNRFGGPGALAVIVSTEVCSNLTRLRANALNISVMDYYDVVKDLKKR